MQEISKENLPPIPYAFPVSEKIENGPSTHGKKVSRAFSATLFFFDVSGAFFSTRYSQLDFTVLTVGVESSGYRMGTRVSLNAIV